VKNRPHILIVMTDQQRADSMACAGHPQIRTPNLDRIAREGIRFAQATTTAPLCMPARASWATGLYPHNHGMWSNRGALSESEATLFQALRRSGYCTALVGKAHFYEHRPGIHLREWEPYMRARGFEVVFETTGPNASVATGSWVTDEWQKRGLWDKLKGDYLDRRSHGQEVVRASVLPIDDYLDSCIGRKAREFVDSYKDARPLCLVVGFGGPHDPWDAPGGYATLYRPEETPASIPVPPKYRTAPPWLARHRAFQVRPPQTLALIPQIRASYYGKISLIDFEIGRILEAFERKGWLDDLLVVFLADHGEMLGDHGRLRKGTFHESGIRIPLIIRWPGEIPANVVSDALVEIVDVFPTLAAAAGCEPAPRCLGQSLGPLFREPAGELKRHQLGEIGLAGRHFMLRTREHKLAVDEQSQCYMLYELRRDPQEQDNLAGDPSAAELERRLRQELLVRLAEVRYDA
jgi:arylsulfatase A-like enzyme